MDIGWTEILVALITGGASIAAVVITTSSSNRKIEQKLQLSQVRTETKLEGLTDEVRRHNNFASRMPSLERDLELLRKDVDMLKKYHSEKV
jgi:hypothetical protein